VTGSFANPITPHELETKIAEVVRQLLRLDEFRSRARELVEDPTQLKAFIAEHVPFAARSTYGGNTTCIEIQTSDSLIIVDTGSGMRRLGEELMRRWSAADSRREAHVLLTHSHMDHTFATPFVDPYYDGRCEFQIWAPHKVLRSLHVVLSPTSKLRSMYFPPTYELLEGVKRFNTIREGDEFFIGSTRVRCFALNHPGGSLAYRLDSAGKSVVIATDHEHADSADLALADFAIDADVLYMDGQYLNAEYLGKACIADETPASRQGWGHSTVEAVVATAIAARAKRVLLGHHDPKRTDEQLASIEQYARCLLHSGLTSAKRAIDSCALDVAHEEQVVIV
jgi:phosphoribosyl 1,2-cyclic phosphodiesterase